MRLIIALETLILKKTIEILDCEGIPRDMLIHSINYSFKLLSNEKMNPETNQKAHENRKRTKQPIV